MSLLLLFGGGEPSLDVSFSGTTAIVFSQTGAFTANSAHAGSATITFGQTGAFRAGANWAGSTSITFSQTGAFTSRAALAGTITVTFNQTGNFDAGFPPAPVSVAELTVSTGEEITVWDAEQIITIFDAFTLTGQAAPVITIQPQQPLTVRFNQDITIITATPELTVH